MKSKMAGLVTAALALGLVLGAGTVTATGGRPAGAAELPGMCNGSRDANLVVIAHANGRPGVVPKYILNVSTDPSGAPSGSLILDRGAGRIVVTDFCRVWQHQPGQPSGGDCETAYPEGAITAHAVGLAELKGQMMLVRTDVRELASGDMYFRVRYRAWSGSEMTAAAETGCEDEGWTWVPAEEGWYPLDQMIVHSTTGA